MLVDDKALNDLISMLDKSTVNLVRLAFLKDSREQMAQLNKAWQEKDLSVIARISLSLKSSSANLALIPLSKSFAELEAIATRGLEHDLPNSLTSLTACYEASVEQLNKYFLSDQND